MNPVRINEWFYDMWTLVMKTPKPVDDLTVALHLARVRQIDASTMEVILRNRTFVLKTNSFPWFETADGGVVFDWCLQTRELLQSLSAPLFGKRFPKPARALAEWYVQLTAAMFQGCDGGGAIYAFGKWHISTRWLPIPAQVVMPIEGALYDDPFSVVGRTLQTGDNLDGENITKALRIAVDPLYHMYRVAGTTVIDVPTFEFLDAQEAFKEWSPTLVFSGGEAMDVVTSSPSYVGDDEAADWASGAYDETYGSGKVIAALQAPLVFDQRNIHMRIALRDGSYWFTKTDKDYKLAGKIDPAALALLPRCRDLKLSWLSQRLGVKLTPGSRLVALYASPLFFVNHKSTFARPLKVITGRWTVTDVALAYVRSDPRAPQELLRYVSYVGKQISIAWLSEAEETFLRSQKWL